MRYARDGVYLPPSAAFVANGELATKGRLIMQNFADGIANPVRHMVSGISVVDAPLAPDGVSTPSAPFITVGARAWQV
jgi:hypothetical protein